MELQSLLAVGNSLFALSRDGDQNKLVITETKYDKIGDVYNIMKSQQPDMLIPPDKAKNINLLFSGDRVYIEHSDKADEWIASSVYENWVFFFFDSEPKILIHVQPKVEEFNYKEYVHAKDDESVDDMIKKLEDMVKNKNCQLEDFFKDIDAIAANVEAMEVKM